MFRLEELQSRVKNRFIEANNLDIANNRSSLTVQSDNNSLEEVDDNDNDNDATDKDSNDSTVEVVEEITEENARKPVVIKADTGILYVNSYLAYIICRYVITYDYGCSG